MVGFKVSHSILQRVRKVQVDQPLLLNKSVGGVHQIPVGRSMSSIVSGYGALAGIVGEHQANDEGQHLWTCSREVHGDTCLDLAK